MSKKIKSEVLNLDIVVNGNKARKEMLDLKDTIEKETAGIKRMNDALNRMAKAGQEGSTRYRVLKRTLDETTASLEANKKRYKDLQQQIPLTGKTIAELRKEIAITRDALAKAVPGTYETTFAVTDGTNVSNTVKLTVIVLPAEGDASAEESNQGDASENTGDVTEENDGMLFVILITVGAVILVIAIVVAVIKIRSSKKK